MPVNAEHLDLNVIIPREFLFADPTMLVPRNKAAGRKHAAVSTRGVHAQECHVATIDPLPICFGWGQVRPFEFAHLAVQKSLTFCEVLSLHAVFNHLLKGILMFFPELLAVANASHAIYLVPFVLARL